VKRQIISTDRGPRTGLPYSQAVLPRPGLLVEIRTVAAMPPRAAKRAAKPARRPAARGRR
jgi:hypothetical protein